MLIHDLVERVARALGVWRVPRVTWFDTPVFQAHSRVLAYVSCDEDHAVLHLDRVLEHDPEQLKFFVRHELRHVSLHRVERWRCDMPDNPGEEHLCNEFAVR